MMGIIKWAAIILLLLEIADLAITDSSRENDSFSKQKKTITKNAFKTIQSEDGDVIECIDMHKQPAFNHPALRNHKIQMVPSNNPTEEIEVEEREFGSSKRVIKQLWQNNGSCPDGTIPIRNNNVHKLNDDEKKDVNLLHTNRSASILITEGYKYYGGKGTVKVWNPSLEFDDEYSLSRVALRGGHYSNYETVESGWVVNPSVYGDKQTRFYTYWTVDGSRKTGCYDLNCPGFVQTSSEVALGAAIYPISTFRGLPYEMTIFIHKDLITGNWWLKYQERITIGYWPGELFKSLKYLAETVEWGGEVYSSRVGVHPHHTATAMGSGQFSDVFAGRSGTIRGIRVLQNPMQLQFPDRVGPYSDEYDCYDYKYLYDYVEDPEFFYGGPGRNWRCL